MREVQQEEPGVEGLPLCEHSTPPMAIRPTILHVDHDTAFAALLRHRVSAWADIEYVGAAYSGSQAHSLCEQLRPAVLVIESQLAGDDGFELSDRIRRADYAPKLIFLTHAFGDYLVYRLGRGCGDGLVWKSQNAADELRAAIHAVMAGRRYFPQEYDGLRRALWSKPAAFFKILSDWEIRLLPLFGKDMSDQEVAKYLGLAKSTVRGHRYNIMAKLGLHKSAALVQWAHAAGFVPTLLPAPPCVAL
jgi:two-component system secretion response regulator SsrB